MKNKEFIEIKWTVEDVQSVCPELTDGQAMVVLDYVLKNHDANQGINWGIIEAASELIWGV